MPASALVSEDRKGEGLAQTRSIADNMTYSRLAPYSTGGWLNLTRRDAGRATLDDHAAGQSPTPRTAVGQLSGGNQQKVALARVLHQDADVLLLDEPTRGIDVGTKAEIYRLMAELAAAGKAIMFVSSYLPELLAVCDRIGVMGRGRLRAIRRCRSMDRRTNHGRGGEYAGFKCIELKKTEKKITKMPPAAGQCPGTFYGSFRCVQE